MMDYTRRFLAAEIMYREVIFRRHLGDGYTREDHGCVMGQRLTDGGTPQVLIETMDGPDYRERRWVNIWNVLAVVK